MVSATEHEQRTDTSGGDWLPPVPWEVLRAPCFTPAQGRVLLVLWSRCNRSGHCWPSLPSIRHDAGCDERTARIAVDTLEHHGVIIVERLDGKAHRYSLNPAAILAFVRCHATPLKNVRGPKRSDFHKEATTPLNFVPAASDKIAGGTELPPVTFAGGSEVTPDNFVPTTPLNFVPTTPLNFVPEPPSILWVEEDPREEDPLEEKPKKKNQRARAASPKSEKAAAKSVEQITAELAVAYQELWTEQEVRDRVTYALNHTASKKWINIEVGLERWLAKDARDEAEKRGVVTGTTPRCRRCGAPGRSLAGGLCAVCRQPTTESPAAATYAPEWGQVRSGPPLAFVPPAEPEPEPEPLSDAAALWAVVAPAIRGRLTPNQWETWLADGIPKSLDGDVLTVSLPTPMAAEHVPRKWRELADDAAAWVAGRPLRVEWVAEESEQQ